jgi:hypothetical protein
MRSRSREAASRKNGPKKNFQKEKQTQTAFERHMQLLNATYCLYLS